MDVILPLESTDESEVSEDLFHYHPIKISLASKERTMHLLNDKMRHRKVIVKGKRYH